MTEPVSPHDARHVEVLAELAAEARKWLPPDSTLGQALDAALEPFKDAGVTEMTPDHAITIMRVRLSGRTRYAGQSPDPAEVLMDEVLRLRSALAAERERCARSMTVTPLHERPEAVRDALATMCGAELGQCRYPACDVPGSDCRIYPPYLAPILAALEPHVVAMIAEAVTAERERCAKVADAFASEVKKNPGMPASAEQIDFAARWLRGAADAIRMGNDR